jgi:hypothetical protein
VVSLLNGIGRLWETHADDTRRSSSDWAERARELEQNDYTTCKVVGRPYRRERRVRHSKVEVRHSKEAINTRGHKYGNGGRCTTWWSQTHRGWVRGWCGKKQSNGCRVGHVRFKWHPQHLIGCRLTCLCHSCPHLCRLLRSASGCRGVSVPAPAPPSAVRFLVLNSAILLPAFVDSSHSTGQAHSHTRPTKITRRHVFEHISQVCIM